MARHTVDDPVGAGVVRGAREPAHNGPVTPDAFPPWFFDRDDEAPDDAFYSWPRLVTHIDDAAIAAVGALYEELGLHGTVLDLMGSWVSHFRAQPRHLTVLGMNVGE